MKKIKVGVIGTGFIGPVHVEAIRRQPNTEVIALSEINEELARDKADSLGIERAYGDYKELIADPDVEVIHICTPNHLHYQIAKEGILAGKHVVCEKPLAMNVEEGKELVELAKEHDAVSYTHLAGLSWVLLYMRAVGMCRGLLFCNCIDSSGKGRTDKRNSG